jgi:hypothetical protein
MSPSMDEVLRLSARLLPRSAVTGQDNAFHGVAAAAWEEEEESALRSAAGAEKEENIKQMQSFMNKRDAQTVRRGTVFGSN